MCKIRNHIIWILIVLKLYISGLNTFNENKDIILYPIRQSTLESILCNDASSFNKQTHHARIFVCGGKKYRSEGNRPYRIAF